MGLISRVSSRTYSFPLLYIKNVLIPKRKIMERTFIAIKPDGVQRGLTGQIISRFEQKGYKLVAMKLCMPGKEHLENHYIDLKNKPFYNGLVEYMNSGPICAMVLILLKVLNMKLNYGLMNLKFYLGIITQK